MKKLFPNLLSVLIGLFVGSALVEGAVYANQDTIFINAEPPSSYRSRSGRDVQVDKDVGGLDTVVVSSRCTTTRGKQGSCQSVDACYPLLFPVNYTGSLSVNSGAVNMNKELINILIEVSGICDMPPNMKASSQNVKPVLDAEFLICCPDPLSFSNDLPTPPVLVVEDTGVNEGIEPLKIQTRSCGKVQVQLTPDEEEYEGDGEDEMKKKPKTGNGTDPEGNRVVGGKDAIPGEFPHMVALLTRNKQFCGGSLIASEWVLTAAHCVQHMGSSDIANLKLVFGDHDIYKPDVPIQSRTAVRVLYHKHFTMKNLQNDIALIKLSAPVEFTKSIQPVCLHDGETSIDGLTGDLAGWGQLCEGCSQPSKLQKAKLIILPHDECVTAYSGIIKITDGMLCAGGQGRGDSCRGDSGGGLTINANSKTNSPDLVGLVSFGVQCGGKPGVFTKLAAYHDWINKNLERFKKP